MPPSSPQPATRAEAAFSPCARWRWWLSRRWDPALPQLLYIGLNPSSADGRRDDPTLRRLQGFARGWGYGGLEVVNLFSRCAASPALLRRCADPVGSETDLWIRRRLRAHRLRDNRSAPGFSVDPAPIWLGWGNGGAWRGRDHEVLRLLAEEGGAAAGGRPLAAIGLTGVGQPRHPLYAPAAARLVPFEAAAVPAGQNRPSGPL